MPALNAGDFAKKAGGGGGGKAMKVLKRMKMGGVPLDKILSAEQRADKRSILAALEVRLFQGSLNTEQEQTLREFLDNKTKLTDADILTTIRLMMSTPEYQVT